MLAHRIIPTFLVKGQILVKGKMFSGDRVIGHARQAIMIQAARGVDELAILDIGATPEGRGPDLSLIEDLSSSLFAPLAVGGGVKTVEHVRDLLKAGADKVVIGTAAIEDPTLLPKLRDTVGSQAVVVAIDHADGRVAKACAKYLTDIDAAAWAKACALHGAGEILLTSVVREGTLEGYDLKTISSVANAVEIPVIAHGGCMAYHDMQEALSAGASAVAAGALFQYTDATPRGAAMYLAKRGIEVRL